MKIFFSHNSLDIAHLNDAFLIYYGLCSSVSWVLCVFSPLSQCKHVSSGFPFFLLFLFIYFDIVVLSFYFLRCLFDYKG